MNIFMILWNQILNVRLKKTLEDTGNGQSKVRLFFMYESVGTNQKPIC